MINTFKKTPLLDAKRLNTSREKDKEKEKDKHHYSSYDTYDRFESDIGRDSRGYTTYSMYSASDEMESIENTSGRKSDIINFERSESVAISKKKIFQNSVQKVIELQALVQKLKSFNSKVVKATLIEMVPLINNPETAVVLKEAGLCTLLLELLKFDPLSHWSIVGLSLQALLSIVSIPECALAVITLPNFPSTIETFLKSDKAMTQIIAGRIVHRCFVQPIQHEWIVVQDRNMLKLLFKAMELPYKDIQISLLNLLEDLTYHCDNTLKLCIYAESIEVDFIFVIVGIIIAEDNADMRLHAMRIYLNALSAMQFDNSIERAVIMHALTIETFLMKHIQSLQRTKAHRTSARASGISPRGSSPRGSKLLAFERGSSRDVSPAAENARPSVNVRRSSIRLNAMKGSAAKFGSEMDDETKKKLELGDKDGGGEGDAGALLQVTEEITVVAEILWLIRSSRLFRRMVDHSKRTNLFEPKDRLSKLISTL